ncbi:MAG TPA: DNA polymerase III subunit beta [Patescibacteria group bacterium]|nr:DNA polymerase III subunit beta [Patescibacteria group bacterium]
MKFSCTQENLNNGLSIVSNIATRNSNLPILNNILFKVKDGKIDLSVTNLEVGVNYFIRGKIETEGSYTLPARVLSDYISLLPHEKIDLELKENHLSVKSSSSKTKIKGIDSSEFPLIPQIKKEEPYSCDINAFIVALQQVSFACSNNETRPEISGIYMYVNPKEKSLTLVATDSYRLSEKTIKIESYDTKKEAMSVIIPSRTVSELARILNNLKKSSILHHESDAVPENLEIYIAENQILFHYDNLDLISRLIEGQYPDYRQIIPGNFKTEAFVNTQELINVVKTSSLFARAGIYDVVLSFKKDKITVSSVNSQLGENVSDIMTKVTGQENSVILNYRYLLDGLLNIQSPEIKIEVTDSNVPCVLRPVLKNEKDEPDYLYLIMPIRQ